MQYLNKCVANIVLIGMVVVLSGCLEFKSVDQPALVLSGETFTAVIEVIHGAGTQQVYLGVCLPQGWRVLGDAVTCTGSYNGDITFDPNLALEQEGLNPSPDGYYWWVGSSDLVDVSDGDTRGVVQIQTGTNTGVFFLDYMLGHSSRGGLDYQRSNGHLIELVDDYTPGGLAASAQRDSVSLRWSAPAEVNGLIGYNVYRNSHLINTDLLENNEYTDQDVPGGVFFYSVAAVYESGQEHVTPYEVEIPVFSGGTGEPEKPYLISVTEQFVSIADDSVLSGQCFALANDLDFSGTFWAGAVIPDFGGSLNGRGFVIQNLKIEGHSNLGLFGRLAHGAQISNLGVEVVDVNGTGYAIGGLVGQNSGTITACYSTGKISGGDDVGGLVGNNGGSITASYSMAAVTGDGNIGGLVGYNPGAIAMTYSTGAVTGNWRSGGLAGRSSGSGQITASFWDTESSGQNSSSGGSGLGTALMQDTQTFLAEGWDLVDETENGLSDFWKLPSEDYPRLRHQTMPEGLGTTDAPYLIQDVQDLGRVWLAPGAHFRLETSLDLSGSTWSTAPVPWFGGSFDGNGHVIHQLNVQGGSDLGLFGVLGHTAIISDLGLDAVTIVGTGSNVGGLAGSNSGTISTSYTTGVTTGVQTVGGLVGNNARGSEDMGTITNCYSTAAVTGNSATGGLVGNNGSSYNYTERTGEGVIASYSGGLVTGTGYDIGGLVGSGNVHDVAISFWDIETSNQPASAGGMGKTSQEMQKATTFSAWGTCASQGMWMLDEGQAYPREGQAYPRLWWEQHEGHAISLGSPLAGLLAGQGTSDDPYLIQTAVDLSWISLFPCDWDKHFKLIADIDLTPDLLDAETFDRAVFQKFSGTFDGNGHVLSHLTIVGDSHLGLFGLLMSGAEVTDLGLVDVNIEGSGTHVGALAGTNWGTISGCYSMGTVSGSELVGGLVGSNQSTGDWRDPKGGHVSFSHSSGVVAGNRIVGGLVGNNNSDIMQCYSVTVVSGTDTVGGLVGENGGYGDIDQCYANSTVVADSTGGGLVGLNAGIAGYWSPSYPASVSNCYSVVEEGSRVSGLLVGQNNRWINLGGHNNRLNPGRIVNCYAVWGGTDRTEPCGLVGINEGWGSGVIANAFWDAQICGSTDNVQGGEPKTTAEMQDSMTFLAWGTCGNEGTWVLDEGRDYPRLWWEDKPGQPIQAQLSEFLEGQGTTDRPYVITSHDDLDAIAYFACEQGSRFRLGFLAGVGTPEEPYMIDTADALELLGACPYELDRHFQLMADLDLSGMTFSGAVIPVFSGLFDGNGYRIANLTISGEDNLGLFGRLESGAVVQDVGLENVEISGLGGYVGGLAGTNSGSITNSYVTGVVDGGYSVGGLVGENARGSIATSYSAGSVSGSGTLGGLVGENDGGSVTTSYSSSTVDGGSRVGGLVGENRSDGRGEDRAIGGIVMSYSSGRVSGDTEVGGLVGVSGGTVVACVWDMESSGLSTSAGGIGLATADMMDPEVLSLNGLEGHPVWIVDAGQDYPRLNWEGTVGQPIGEPDMGWLPGGGTPENPYCIETSAQLSRLSTTSVLWDRCFRLCADLDMDPNLPDQTGFRRALIPSFSGVFDGNGYAISNLWIIGTEYVGLFGRLQPEAEVRNLSLAQVHVTGTEDYVGGLAGSSHGSIVAVNVTGSVTGEGRNVGGLAGYNSGNITRSSSHCTVTGGHRVGGLLGDNQGGSIVQSFSTGTITGEVTVGGLVGSHGSGSITTSYSTAKITGDQFVGGIVGYNYGSISNSYNAGPLTGNEAVGGLAGHNRGTIATSYSVGTATGNEKVGGLVGDGDPARVTAGIWDMETSKLSESAGGTGKSTVQMQLLETFADAGWDCGGETLNGTDDIWWMLEGHGTPGLWWESTPRCAAFPVPQHEARDVLQPLILSWQVGTSGAYHDVYIGQDRDAVALATHEDVTIYQGRLPAGVTTFEPGPLSYGETYYWRIAEVNEAESNTSCRGMVWTFTTADFIGSLSPRDKARGIRWPALLTWEPSGPALPYDVYFGDNKDAVAQATRDSVGLYRGRQNADETTFMTGNLHPQKTYFWRLDGVDSVNPLILWKGKVREFTTAGPFVSHYPVERDTHSPEAVTLTWTPSGPGLSYDVYFGEDRRAVTDATHESQQIYRGRQAPDEMTFDPGVLEPGRIYFWRIDALDMADPQNVWKGAVWKFTTTSDR